MTHHKNQKMMILAIALGVILNPINTTMITVALPEIQKDFILSSTDLSWLIASYFIVSAIFTPLIGKLSDVYGRKFIFLLGLAVALIASVVAPLSQNFITLLIIRGVQAIGSSALFPAGVGIVRNTIKENQNRVIGTLSVFTGVAAALGPTIGGLLIEFGGWPIIFYVNVPVIVVGVLLAFIFIPKDVKVESRGYKLDGMGIILFSLFITAWMVFLLGLENGIQFMTLAIAILLTYFFYIFEKKKKTEAFINVQFFQKNAHVAYIYVQFILSIIIFFSILLSFPTFMQSVLGTSSKLAGFAMLPLSLLSVIVTPLSTRWMERAGFRLPLMFSLLFSLAGVILLFTLKDNSSLVWVGILLGTFGISSGIQNIGLQNLLFSYIAAEESGIASGLLMTSRFIGNILAASIYGIAFSTGIKVENMGTIAMILVVVVLIMIPGMLFVTAAKNKEKQKS